MSSCLLLKGAAERWLFYVERAGHTLETTMIRCCDGVAKLADVEGHLQTRPNTAASGSASRAGLPMSPNGMDLRASLRGIVRP
jgi:hypothetical protein